MRIQIYTQHFVPEVTAGRYRVEAFASRFAERGHEVEVICPVPNHPQGVIAPGYGGAPVVRRRVNGARVAYLWVKTSPRKSTRARLAYYGSYAAAALAVGARSRPRPDLILASSPPLPVAAAACSVAALRRVPWIFDVRDLWPKAAVIMGELSSPRLVRLSERLEATLYRRADLILAVTRPFATEIASSPGAAEVELVPNGTTRAWLEAGERDGERAGLGLPADRFIWSYAGNLGPSRRLELAIEAARRLGDGFGLLMIGDGGARAQLEALARTLPAGAVRFCGLLSAERTAEHLRATDALFVPQQAGLGDFVPSKLYDCAALGRPLVVAADGETARLAREAGIAIAVPPDDPGAVAGAIRRLRDEPDLGRRLTAAGREFAADHLRERQADRVIELAEALVGAHASTYDSRR